MLEWPWEINYVILLCDELEEMRSFYEKVFGFTVISESPTHVTFDARTTRFGLRKRTRSYDKPGSKGGAPRTQIALRVTPEKVAECFEQLQDMGVTILEPLKDQDRGHRTTYFSDPEGNILEIFAEI